MPLPTPIRELTFNFEIQYDGFGYLFCYASEDQSVYGDTWHETLAEAENVAQERFGILPGEWNAAELQ